VNQIPDDVRQFIFEHVDSVTQLEVLFLLHNHTEREFDAEDVAKELRANIGACSKYLEALTSMGLLKGSDGSYHYEPDSPELNTVIKHLIDSYKIRPHKLMELIFSNSKKARNFADAFNLSKSTKRDGEDNG
jgi:hypothetical protein